MRLTIPKLVGGTCALAARAPAAHRRGARVRTVSAGSEAAKLSGHLPRGQHRAGQRVKLVLEERAASTSGRRSAAGTASASASRQVRARVAGASGRSAVLRLDGARTGPARVVGAGRCAEPRVPAYVAGHTRAALTARGALGARACAAPPGVGHKKDVDIVRSPGALEILRLTGRGRRRLLRPARRSCRRAPGAAITRFTRRSSRAATRWCGHRPQPLRLPSAPSTRRSSSTHATRWRRRGCRLDTGRRPRSLHFRPPISCRTCPAASRA